jgi:hypothetical protein
MHAAQFLALHADICLQACNCRADTACLHGAPDRLKISDGECGSLEPSALDHMFTIVNDIQRQVTHINGLGAATKRLFKAEPP